MIANKNYRLPKYAFEESLTQIHPSFEIHDVKENGIKLNLYYVAGKHIATWANGAGFLGDKKEKPVVQLFRVGDRVELSAENHPFHNSKNGVVVYHFGDHSTRSPRVRWASGFGTTVKANQLRLMTTEEKNTLKMPRTIAEDFVM